MGSDPKQPRPARREDGFPTRADVSLFSEGERVIWNAVDVVEGMGASMALTDAVVLLGKARDRVADHVEGIGDIGSAVDPLRMEINALKAQLQRERDITEHHKKNSEEAKLKLVDAQKIISQHEQDHKTLGDEEVERIAQANTRIAELEKENAGLREQLEQVFNQAERVCEEGDKLEEEYSRVKLIVETALKLMPEHLAPSERIHEGTMRAYAKSARILVEEAEK